MPHRPLAESLTAQIQAHILRLLPAQGRLETAVPGLSLTRHDAETSPERCLCSPMIAFVAQGLKRTFYGARETNYGKGQCVVLGDPSPKTGPLKSKYPPAKPGDFPVY